MKKLFYLIFLLDSLSVLGQKEGYPQGYFMFPINPGQQNFLAGGVGDLRPNHFHAGIDIKTQFQEGLPVYAAAEGYVAKIMVMPSGYGNVLFIKHSNGYQTTYAHLKDFAEPIRSYVIRKRLEKQTFEIELNPDNEQFKVKKGQVIAFSGNTGSSAGPHLHFEIRDARDNILNPLYFGFSEIKDTSPPIFQQIIVKPLDINARIGGDFSRKLWNIKKINSSYVLPEVIKAEGLIGLELLAFDKLDGVTNTNGLTCIEVKVNGEEVFYYHFEQLPYDYQHDINIHNDYALEQLTGQRFQKLFIANGNDRLPFYNQHPSKGKINIEVGKQYQVEISIWDQHQNKAELRFQIVGEKALTQTALVANKLPTQTNYSIEENILHIKAKNFPVPQPSCQLFDVQDSTKISAQYMKDNQAHFLIDLSKEIITKIKINQQTIVLPYKTILSNQENTLEVGNLSLQFSARTLYNTLALITTVENNGLAVGTPTTPLREHLMVKYIPNTTIIPDKTYVYLLKNGIPFWLDGVWKDNVLQFETANFGKFKVLTDTIPPFAQIIQKGKEGFAVRVQDNLSGIGKFKAVLNDEFILMDYDPKRALLWSVKQDTTQHFLGKLHVEISDKVGNKTILQDSIFNSPGVVWLPRKKKRRR